MLMKKKYYSNLKILEEQNNDEFPMDLVEYGIHPEFVWILKNTAGKFSKEYSNYSIDYSDYESELWIKLLEILPKIGDMSFYESLKFVKVCLKNRGYDLVREYAAKPDCSYWREEINDQIVISANYYFNLLNSLPSPVEEIKVKELKRILNYISSKYKGIVSNYIISATCPPSSILEEWEIMIAKTPRLRSYSYIPPFSLGKILGMKPFQVYKVLGIIITEFNIVGYTLKLTKGEVK